MSQPTTTFRRVLSLRDLVLFNVAAVIGLRWLAAAASIGTISILLWVVAAVGFFVPSAIAVSKLAARFPEQGGLYVWTKEAFGPWHGFLCGWAYVVSNLFYFPNLLLAGVGMGAQALGFAENKAAMVTVSLLILWLVLIANLIGLGVGKWTNNIGAIATYGGGSLVIVLGAAAWFHGTAATSMHLAPRWDFDKLNFFSQIAFAFAGLELSSVMAEEIRNPRRNVPLAAYLAGALITGFYVLGTISILVLVPSEKVNVITGLVQAGQAAGARFGLPWVGWLLSLLVLGGVAGQMSAWVGGTARLPFVIGMDRLLPAPLARLHPRWGTPHVAILAQGVACTVVLLLSQAGENLKAGYQILIDLTVIVYFLPFLYLFGAAWRCGERWSAASGFAITALAILLSFVPPPGAASVWLFEAKLLAGCGLVGGSAWLLYRRARRRIE